MLTKYGEQLQGEIALYQQSLAQDLPKKIERTSTLKKIVAQTDKQAVNANNNKNTLNLRTTTKKLQEK